MTILIANKLMRYATRRLRAGDEFDAIPEHARFLVAVKMAREKPAEAKPAKPACGVKTILDLLPPNDQSDNTLLLRDHYRQIARKDPDMRWGATRLQQEISNLTTGEEG